jgi:hypothetical protein
MTDPFPCVRLPATLLRDVQIVIERAIHPTIPVVQIVALLRALAELEPIQEAPRGS